MKSYVKESLKVKLFALFCGLTDDAGLRGDAKSLDFYLLCLQVLSPSNVMLLFPDEDAAVFWVKPMRSLEVRRCRLTSG